MTKEKHLEFADCLEDKSMDVDVDNESLLFKCRTCKRLVLMPREMNGVTEADIANLKSHPGALEAWLENSWRRFGQTYGSSGVLPEEDRKKVDRVRNALDNLRGARGMYK